MLDVNGQQAGNNTPIRHCVDKTGLELSAVCTGTGENNSTFGYQHRIRIFQATTSGSPGAIAYQTGWQNGPLPIIQDLRNLPGLNGDVLGTTPGDYIVEAAVRNNCNTDNPFSRSFWLRIEPIPGPLAVGFTINNGLTGIPCAPTKTLPGCATGNYAASLNLSNSTGPIDWYRLQIVEVNCTTGIEMDEVHNEQYPLSTPISSLTAISLNGLVINGQTGYFLNRAGRCYKLTVTIGTFCAEVSDWSYFQIECCYREAKPLVTYQATSPLIISPNPIGDAFFAEYALPPEAQISQGRLSILDATGRIVWQETLSLGVPDNTQRWKVSVPSLPAGVYAYTWEAGPYRSAGRLQKH
ncbi:MAG: hypothetical protein D6722_00570 [Bacteroidetes bacterium]|nr:MAG: hypothetical protein D6722_00570 [Bacteroidota bacterium]